MGVAATMVTGLTSVAVSTDSYLSSGAPIDIRVQGTTAQQDIDSLTAQVKDVDGVQTVVAVPELSLRLTPENKDAYSDTRGDDDFTVHAVDEAAVAPVIRSHHGLEGLDDGTLIVGGIYHLAEGSKVTLTGPAGSAELTVHS